MTFAELLTAVDDVITAYPILTAVMTAGAVFGALSALVRAIKRGAK